MPDRGSLGKIRHFMDHFEPLMHGDQLTLICGSVVAMEAELVVLIKEPQFVYNPNSAACKSVL